MNLSWRITSVVIFAICAVAFFTVVKCAKAHELSEGSGVLCDKSVQVEMFAAYGAQIDAVQTINADAHENVCVMATVRYIYGHEIKRVRTSERAMQIVEVLVLQFKHQGQWTNLPPTIQYTLFEVVEEPA